MGKYGYGYGSAQNTHAYMHAFAYVTHMLSLIWPLLPQGQSLFSIYVTLPRSSGQSTIRLLHDFDDQLFTQSFEPSLIQDDEQLKVLDRKTESRQQKKNQ